MTTMPRRQKPAPERLSVRLDADVRALLNDALWADPTTSISSLTNDGLRESLRRRLNMPTAWKPRPDIHLTAAAEFLAEMVRSDILPDELAENARELLAKTNVEV